MKIRQKGEKTVMWAKRQTGNNRRVRVREVQVVKEDEFQYLRRTFESNECGESVTAEWSGC